MNPHLGFFLLPFLPLFLPFLLPAVLGCRGGREGGREGGPTGEEEGGAEGEGGEEFFHHALGPRDGLKGEGAFIEAAVATPPCLEGREERRKGGGRGREGCECL